MNDSVIHLISHIENRSKQNFNWIKAIMFLSNSYYRFSEYKSIATFMNNYYPELLSYYPFYANGKNGIRYRESNEIIEKIINFCKNDRLTYEMFKEFIKNTYQTSPSYIQLEHIDRTVEEFK